MPDAVCRAFASPDAATALILRLAEARDALAPELLRALAMMLDGAIAQAAASPSTATRGKNRGVA